MEGMALDADRGLREDFIPWKELHRSDAIQGKDAVRSEHMMAHAEFC